MYLSDEKEGDDDRMSKSMVTVEMAGRGDKKSAVEIRPDYLINAPIEEDYDILRP